MGHRPCEKMDDRAVRRFLRDLQRVFPCLYPVLYRRVPMKDWGNCTVERRGRRRYIVISIADWIEYPGDYMVLIHEYAHARAWLPDKLEQHIREDHDEVWGVKHAELWRKAHSRR